MDKQSNLYQYRTAAAVIIANMVGTGVFTSLGFQLQDIQSAFVLLLLWFVGGITALCGALCYAELAAAMPRSGGEYNFLGKIYHPSAGFTSGWISATIGFAAPSALVALTFGNYLSSIFPDLNAKMLAVTLVLVVTVAHCFTRRASGNFQTFFTLLKILLIASFCVAAFIFVEHPQDISFMPQENDWSLIGSGAFAVSLIYVNYAYTGWNAVTYLTDEIESPQKNIPKALILGTATVIVLYLLLNTVFLWVAPIKEMQGKVEIGYIAAQHAFGSGGAVLMGSLLAILLISTVSAMLMAGPRVLKVMGEDIPLFSRLAKTNQHGVPTTAIIVQSLVTLVFLISASFESILIFAGFTLAINTLFTVLGLFILRWRQPELERPYKTWLYPLPPLIYLAITLWSLVYIVINKPEQTWASFGIIGAGFVAYYLSQRFSGSVDGKTDLTDEA